MERANELTANYLILTSSYGTPGASSFLANPLVRQLPAVKDKQVLYTTAGYGFGSGSAQAGPLGEEAALSAVQRAFAAPASTKASDASR
jgi:ABC-type Fe3+-hydroxamate transport system substrate-binding protein